jgi:hypothetical protein
MLVVKENDHLGGVDGKIILKWVLRKYGMRLWSGFMWLRTRSNGGLL